MELFFVVGETCYPVTHMQSKCIHFFQEMSALDKYQEKSKHCGLPKYICRYANMNQKSFETILLIINNL